MQAILLSTSRSANFGNTPVGHIQRLASFFVALNCRGHFHSSKDATADPVSLYFLMSVTPFIWRWYIFCRSPPPVALPRLALHLHLDLLLWDILLAIYSWQILYICNTQCFCFTEDPGWHTLLALALFSQLCCFYLTLVAVLSFLMSAASLSSVGSSIHQLDIWWHDDWKGACVAGLDVVISVCAKIPVILCQDTRMLKTLSCYCGS